MNKLAFITIYLTLTEIINLRVGFCSCGTDINCKIQGYLVLFGMLSLWSFTGANTTQTIGNANNGEANAAAPAAAVGAAGGGGAMFEEEDDDGRNRDWLDWLYVGSRLGVLLSIIYFYSTVGR